MAFPCRVRRSGAQSRLSRLSFAQKLTQIRLLAPDAYAALEGLANESLTQCWRDARAKLIRASYTRVAR